MNCIKYLASLLTFFEIFISSLQSSYSHTMGFLCISLIKDQTMIIIRCSLYFYKSIYIIKLLPFIHCTYRDMEEKEHFLLLYKRNHVGCINTVYQVNLAQQGQLKPTKVPVNKREFCIYILHLLYLLKTN